MIKATGLNKSYGSSHVLRDIDIELNSGEITVLFGPSGCGKTTLLRNLSLLDVPDSGELEIMHYKYLFPSKEKKILLPFPKLTIVFQQLFLWPNLSNRENVMLAISKNQVDYDIREAYLRHLIEEMEMISYIDKFPNESSLGQKQRVAIARALILNPEFVFFDEITASLDIAQILNIINILLKLKNNKIGILFITHNISIANKIGDKLVFMQSGKIIESGGKKILSSPSTKELRNFLNLF